MTDMDAHHVKNPRIWTSIPAGGTLFYDSIIDFPG